MFWLKEFFLRLHATIRRDRIDREIDEEMRFHLEMRSRENIEAGMTPAEAHRDALRRFGNLTYIKERSRDVRGGGMIETFMQDFRYSIRMLGKQPLFTATAVITLALGIGATTTVFSIVDAVLWRPLPFQEPHRLVQVWEWNQRQEKDSQVSSVGNFVDWQTHNQVFDNMAAYFTWNANLIGDDAPERVTSAVVTGRFFQVLGVGARIGRVLLPSDDQPGQDDVVLLSYGLWQRRFGGDPGIVGSKLALSGGGLTIVGILPPEFRFPDEQVEIWVPAGFAARQLQDRRGKFIKVLARLKPEITLKQAQAEMSAIAAQLEQHHPDSNSDWEVKVARLDGVLVGKVRLALCVLLGAVGFVLLITCVNVANLLLARATARRREFAIRVALGASRMRLASQLLTESFSLAMLGGLLGILLAYGGVSIILSLSPGDIPRLEEAGINGRVLGFTFVTSVLSVIIIGLLPALYASPSTPQESLKAEGSSIGGGSKRRLRHALVVSEVAIALVLLIGAGLMMKSFWRLQSVSPGFSPENLLTLRIWLPANRYAENQRQILFFQELLDRIEKVPGVQGAGAIQDLPMRRNRMGFDYVIEGRPSPSGGDKQDAAYRVVTPDYFATMGIPLLSGRPFSVHDTAQTLPVVIINQSFARQGWPDGEPLGQRLRFGGEEAPWYVIVGVVGDVKHMGLDAEEGPAIYQPHAQKPEFLRWMTLVVRASGEPMSLVSAVRRQVQAVDKDQPVYEIASMEQLLYQSVANPRFYMVLLGLFAFLSLVLAAVGVYGVLAFWVTQRTREIGIHLALGAQPGYVMRSVLRKGFNLALVGVGVGLVATFLLTQVIESLLYEVSPTDPMTFAGLSLLLLVIAILACYMPARRATKVDPMIALRYE